MELSRCGFIVGTAACAGALCAGCIVLNPAPTFDAAADGTMPIPPELSKPGAQIKVRLPKVDEPVLVWRTADGYQAASVVCTHRESTRNRVEPGGLRQFNCRRKGGFSNRTVALPR